MIALLMSLWLGMLVPAHQGHWVANDGHHSDHAMLDARDAAGHEHGEPKLPHDHSRCAICLFASTLAPPPVIDWGLSRHDRVMELPPIDAADLVAAEFIPPFRGRAPPAV